ncbi:N-formylglutamate amidohydrolase [Sphingomonas sp.]|uniref:N-formylglutamate amidohydrolase n=1 Tax=Sphingomonas sp. TaxID=28214 RepID=UPI00180F11DE|nr:N-formylglutamate amidohydrolase [Sphingomonas sp.]MBA3512490.1 N-formylglutamate amidohydrolase [Sphingomonas sp.]
MTLAESHITPLPAPIVHPPRAGRPVLLSVPHSGRDYPDWLVAMASGGRRALAALEDPLVDRLVWRAVQHGTAAVIARAPRAAVDCNRAEDDIDPSVIEGGRRGRVSARARGGLGIVPGRTQSHGYLWRRSIGSGQLEDRLDQAHRPYHRALAEQLGELAGRYGGAILLDCHSMPPPARGVAPIVLGDCHGRSAAPWVSAEAVRIVRSAGFVADLNDPFAGGHIVERHGAPERGIHALQVEIDRRAYLNERLDEPGPGFDAIASLIEALASGLGDLVLSRQFATAAE